MTPAARGIDHAPFARHAGPAGPDAPTRATLPLCPNRIVALPGPSGAGTTPAVGMNVVRRVEEGVALQGSFHATRDSDMQR